MVFLNCRSRSVLMLNAHTAPSVHHEWLTLKHFTGCLTQPQMQKTKISMINMITCLNLNYDIEPAGKVLGLFTFVETRFLVLALTRTQEL